MTPEQPSARDTGAGNGPGDAHSTDKGAGKGQDANGARKWPMATRIADRLVRLPVSLPISLMPPNDDGSIPATSVRFETAALHPGPRVGCEEPASEGDLLRLVAEVCDRTIAQIMRTAGEIPPDTDDEEPK